MLWVAMMTEVPPALMSRSSCSTAARTAGPGPPDAAANEARVMGSAPPLPAAEEEEDAVSAPVPDTSELGRVDLFHMEEDPWGDMDLEMNPWVDS